jgi:hypothetical protein
MRAPILRLFCRADSSLYELSLSPWERLAEQYHRRCGEESLDMTIVPLTSQGMDRWYRHVRREQATHWG